MKLYTFFTDSHRGLLDVFLDNFPFKEDIELCISWFPQECKDANFMSNGWNKTMYRKVKLIIQALDETPEDSWFVHSDCDIVLFDGWDDIYHRNKEDADMIIQDDYSSLCAGFFFCKNNNKTRALWNSVLNGLDSFEHDQAAMNYFIKTVPDLRVGVLPPSYFTYGFFNKTVWTGQEFNIPDASDLKMFHANWTVGTENKLKLLSIAINQKNLSNDI
jgi:hypothetical protein